MAQRKEEAWLTFAMDDASVANAMVLAESLRRTKTTRTIAVITCRNLAIDKRCTVKYGASWYWLGPSPPKALRIFRKASYRKTALGKVFDTVFYTDQSYNFGGEESKREDNVLAKMHALSLCFLKKFVYVTPDTLILENVDWLFEAKTQASFLARKDNGSADLSLFVIRPTKKLWNSLQESLSKIRIMTDSSLMIWLDKYLAGDILTVIPDDIIAKFSIPDGILLNDKSYASIIQFIGMRSGANIFEDLETHKDKKHGCGLREKLIMDKWLNIFKQNTLPILQNATTASVNIEIGEPYLNEPITIIGMSCRYPEANSVQEFWNLLYRGEEGIREPPAFRWTRDHTIRVTQQDGKINAGFLSMKVDEFDARFFGVSPAEAIYLDPQIRILYEVLWESLEDAGIDPLSLRGSHTGIFTGSWMNDYKDIVQGSTEKDFFRTYMGNSMGAAAARLSFLLGLTGPSIATESGCSSAIVALDLAVKCLRNGESNLAMVGGINLILHPFTSDMIGHVIAPNGRCKTFDSKADGFGRAEGCGVLVLKRLSDSLRDRDNIWALIRGSAISQEGLSRSLGTPTVHCEALAMKLALEDANVKPEEVTFVETHGTGTPVGDPMEVAAIAKAYFSPSRTSPLVIGSVKTNVGHTESCSGITGIMKTVLAMQHELIPQHQNFESLNPEIFLESIPAMIPLEPLPWPKVTGKPRIAGVSSFGITGTDGHVIIQEAPDYELPQFTLGLERPTHILKVSGKTDEALDDLLTDYEKLLSERAGRADDGKDMDFENIAFSANSGRATFGHRAFIVANNCADAATILREKRYLQGIVKDACQRQICFLFTGQGSQYQGMAKTLYETSPVFRINFDACDHTLQKMYNLTIRDVLWNSDPSSKELGRTIYSQTSIFCVEYCLLKLWQSWGVEPDFVLGHSLGEFCAAVAAGILDFEDALKLVAERSKLIDSLEPASMLVIKSGKQEVEKLLRSAEIALDFAAVNSPEQTVIAGDTEKVQYFLRFLKDQGVKATILEASHAFHSRQMDPILEIYRHVAETVNYKQGNGRIQYVSGLEGRMIGDFSELNADYWVRHTRDQVSFVNACATLREFACEDYIEIGPQPVLSSFVMVNNYDSPINCLPSLRRGMNDWETLLTSLGKLYLLGYNVDWEGFDEPYVRNKVKIPSHPLYKKSFWVEPTGDNTPMIHPLLGYPMNNASTLHIFQNDLTVKSVPYLKDHCIGKRIIFPGAGYIEMCLSAGYCVANGLSDTLELPRRPMKLVNVKIEAPLELKEEKRCRFQVLVDLLATSDQSNCNNGFKVKVFHQNPSNDELDKWFLHASSTLIPVVPIKEPMKKWNPGRIANIISTCEPLQTDQFYSRSEEAGLMFGNSFRTIQKYWAAESMNKGVNADEIVSEMRIPPDQNKYLLHPLIIDAVLQSIILTTQNYESSRLKVPLRLGGLTMFLGVEALVNNRARHGDTLYMHACFEEGSNYAFISTTDFIPIAFFEDIEFLQTTAQTIDSVLDQQSSSIADAWEESWKVIPSPFSSRVELADAELVFKDPHLLQTFKGVTDKGKDEICYDRLIYLYIIHAFLELGWKPKLEQLIDVRSFCEELGIQPKFHKLIRYYFTVLHEEAGILSGVRDDELSWKVCALPPSVDSVNLEMGRLRLALEGTLLAEKIKLPANVAKSLVKVLTGQESALALIFPTDEKKQEFSADHYYQTDPGRWYVLNIGEKISRRLQEDTLAITDPDPGKVYRVLEVGAGTGSLSLPMLQILRENWGDRFEYYFTDISPSYFAKAEKKLAEFASNIKYAVFDIEKSPLHQGIPLNYFDKVVATDVLHATRSLEESCVHLRQVLRSGGILAFTETATVSRGITFAFGLLEGYWRFTDFHIRPHHCCVGEQVWEQVLTNCGFRSVNTYNAYLNELVFIFAVADPQVHVDALIIPETRENSENNIPKNEWVIFTDSTNLEATSHIANMLDVSGSKVTMVVKMDEGKLPKLVWSAFTNDSITFKSIQSDNEDPSEIEGILAGRDGSVHGIVFAWGAGMNENDHMKIALPMMHIVKTIIGCQKPPQLYVITKGVHAVSDDEWTCNPSAATLFGMLKSYKNEKWDAFVRCVDLDGESPPSVVADQILFELAMNRGGKEQQRFQVAYRGNVRYEPKLVKFALPREKNELKLPPSTERYQLVLPKSKLIQDLEFDVLEDEDVRDNEVEVKVKAYALNFRDLFAILKPSETFESINSVGLDFAGVVTKVGSSSSKLMVGDHVFGANNFKESQLSSHLVLEPSTILRIPDKLTFWEAATLPAVFSTAYHCLINFAKMKKEDTVLIHTGSGGVGLAAVQLAKHVGANIITTGGSRRKRAFLKSLGIQHVFHSRNTSFEKDILRVTNGRGVDIVLNSITGPGIKEATLNVCAEKARFVEMSKLNIWSPEEVNALRPDVEYSVVDLTVLKPSEWKALLHSLEGYLAEGHLKPVPYVKYDALNIREALQHFQKARHIGKVVCSMPEVFIREGQFRMKMSLFNSESTYLITGGLGGIGFEVCKWMLEFGAMDIVLMGRSAPKLDVAMQIKELNDKGANVMVRLGDVSNFDRCKEIFDEIGQGPKPFRGVLHCAGVVRDSLYDNLTWDHFEATFAPKVTGTWNLHNLTRNLHMEHFVVFSSMAALFGIPGQANHSAANSFEDALIHYRHSLGLPGCTVNWGQWAQVGVAKEMNILGIRPISVKRMLNGLELAIKRQRRQTGFCEFENIDKLSIMCPLVKHYLDERLWKQLSNVGQSSHDIKAEHIWKKMDSDLTEEDKIGVMSEYLKGVLRTALRLEPSDPINDDANLQELGVDSLMMIELKNSIQSLCGARVTITTDLIRNCNSIRLIAGALVRKLMENEEDSQATSLETLSPPELLQLLEKDCVLDESIQCGSLPPPLKPSQTKTVLITGAGGQLALQILSHLTSKLYSSVVKVVCLFRERGVNVDSLSEKLEATLNSKTIDMIKLECISGDVTKEYLGLSQVKYNELANDIDAVFHCAAKFSHSEQYLNSGNGKLDDCRSVNLVGTQNILKFASTSKIKHVYFPSMLFCGLFQENEEGTLSDSWNDQKTLESISFHNNVPATFIAKFICEFLLHQAIMRGIPCKVFRFPLIAGESVTGLLDPYKSLYIMRFISFLTLRRIPVVPVPVNVLPIDKCAQFSLKLFFSDEAPLEIFNISHPHPQAEQEFVSIAKENFGKDVEIVEPNEFSNLLDTDTTLFSDELRKLFKNQGLVSMHSVQAFQIFKGYVVSPETFFSNRKILKYIPEYEQEIPSSMEIIRRDLAYLKSTGFLQNFNI